MILILSCETRNKLLKIKTIYLYRYFSQLVLASVEVPVVTIFDKLIVLYREKQLRNNLREYVCVLQRLLLHRMFKRIVWVLLYVSILCPVPVMD